MFVTCIAGLPYFLLIVKKNLVYNQRSKSLLTIKNSRTISDQVSGQTALFWHAGAIMKNQK